MSAVQGIVGDVASFISGNIIAVIAVVGILAIVFFALKGRVGFKKDVKLINRADIMKKKMISILMMNKGRMMVLKQKGNIIGITNNIGKYVNGKNTIYFILYMPRLFLHFPKFWCKNVLIISAEYVEIITEPARFNPVTSFIIKDSYFIDEYFGMKISFSDVAALDILKLRILADESEISSSAYLAQALRLSTLDLAKPFEAPIIKEAAKVAGVDKK